MARNVGRTPQKSTPQLKVEPTNQIYKQSGDKSAGAALARDKSSVRATVPYKK